MNEASLGEEFWEGHYRGVSPNSNGRPSSVLTEHVERRQPGHALDLGCAKGDDAVWLASQGWRVTAVDVSQTVLGYAKSNAQTAGVADRVTFAKHDLGQSFPAGAFDLVSALFLHSPVEFPRAQVLRRAAAAVRKGGLLVIASHGSAAPWSWADPDTVFPGATDILDDLHLDLNEWNRVFVGPSVRQAAGPGGQTADVTDIHVILERRPSA